MLAVLPFQNLSNDPAPEYFLPKASSAATRALELDNALADAHSALGAEKADFEFDWQEADEEFERAIALNPSSASAHFFYSAYYLNPIGGVGTGCRRDEEGS